MKTVQIEFSKYELVNFLWPELIEDYGFDKARKIVSQAIDLQKMNGTKKLECELTIKDGKIVYDLNGLASLKWDE